MTVIGIDLGANHVRYVHNNQILFDEPGRIAYDNTNKPIAIGWQALDLAGQSKICSISSIQHLEAFLEELFAEFNTFSVFSRTDVFMCFPSTFSEKKCEQICQFIIKKGAREVIYDQAIWCVACSNALSFQSNNPTCLLYLDQQEATIVTLANSEIQSQESYSIHGCHIEESIRQWILNQYRIQLSLQSLESLMEHIGQINPQKNPLRIQIHGIDTKTQKMKTILVDENQVAQALSDIASQWVHWIYQFISKQEKATQQAIIQNGVYCCGQAMTLNGLGSFFQSQLRIPFHLLQPSDQLTTIGIKEILKQFEGGILDED